MQEVFDKYAARAGINVDELINNKLVLYREQGLLRGLTNEQMLSYAREEVIADSMLDVIGDERTIRAMAIEDRNLIRRLQDWISKTMNQIHAMLGDYAANSREARVLTDTEGALREMQERFNEALEETEALQKAKKAGQSLGSNSRMMDTFVNGLDSAATYEEANAEAVKLAHAILTEAGFDPSDGNINSLLGASVLLSDGGTTISEALEDTPLEGMKTGPEINRALRALGRYTYQLIEQDGENGTGYYEALFETGETENAAEGKRYSPKGETHLRDQIRAAAPSLDKMDVLKTVDSKIDLTPYYARGAKSQDAAYKAWVMDEMEKYDYHAYREGFGNVLISQKE